MSPKSFFEPHFDPVKLGLLLAAVVAALLLGFARLLEASETKRRRFAIGGAAMFMIGTGLQLAATF
jgi:hypothetical protein